MRKLIAALKVGAERRIEEETYRPVQFRLAATDGFEQMQELLRVSPGIRVHDTLSAQLRDLVRARHPERKLADRELDELVMKHLGDSPLEEYGSWFYYPWSLRLVHLLDETEFVELRTNRNRYKITSDEQAQLLRKRIGVVGLSVGHSVALTLALERSFGELRLADFDRLDLSNLNRVRVGVHNLSLPKVYITAREIAEIDPYLRVTCFPQGVTEKNCEAFLLENSALDVVIDECDSIDIKILLRQLARDHQIPVVMETSDRGMIDIERFDLEPQRDIFHGLIEDLGSVNLRGLTTEEKIPYVLRIIGADTMSSRLRASLIEVEQSISTWPQLASAVANGSGAAADVVRRICLSEPIPSGRYYIDLDKLIESRTQGASPSVFQQRPAYTPPALQKREMLSAIRRLPRPGRPSATALSPDLVRRLVGDATLAPSGGNCQPWKWVADGDRLYLFHDLSRSSTPFDPNGRGGLVALGASTENLVLSAHAAGLQLSFDLLLSEELPELVGRFQFRPDPQDCVEPHWRDELYSMVDVRRTNRKLCTSQPLKPSDKDHLTEAVQSVPGAEICWLQTDGELNECGAVIGAGDRVLFLTQRLHQFLVDEIRWTPAQTNATRDGISLECLDLAPPDQAAFQLCRDWSALDMVGRWRGGRGLEKVSRKAIDSASAVGLITMPSHSPAAYFWGGRAMERLWLTAAERQLALHPMTALCYLFPQYLSPTAGNMELETQEMLRELYPRFKKLFPVQEFRGNVLLFRVSYAEQTSRRSLRRSLDDSLIIA